MKHKPQRGQRRKPRALDLFCGAGGLTLGLRRAGYRVLAAVEVDALAAEAYRANHRHVRVFEQDIRRLSVKSVMAQFSLKPGELELLAGCPPCQGFSTMTTLNGGKQKRDPRNDLVGHFLRFVRVLRPKSVMLENVPRLAHNWRFRKLLRGLRGLNYQVNHRILNAADYLVPQRRRRLILIASRTQEPAFAKPARAQRTVRDAIYGLHKRRRRDPLHESSSKRSERIVRLIRQVPKNGGSRSDLGTKKQLACHKRCDGFKDVYGRMRWNDVAPTITGGCLNPSKGRFLHPSRNRAITLREAALLQGFPRSYKFPLRKGRYAAALLIGNALPPEFIARHARTLKPLYQSKLNANA